MDEQRRNHQWGTPVREGYLSAVSALPEFPLQGEHVLSQKSTPPRKTGFKGGKKLCMCVCLKFKGDRITFIFQNERRKSQEEFSKVLSLFIYLRRNSFLADSTHLRGWPVRCGCGPRGGGAVVQSSVSRVPFL